MPVYSVFLRATGIFTGERISSLTGEVLLSDEYSLIEGEHDPESTKVAPDGTILLITPAKPPSDEWQDWTWDATSWKWIPFRTVGAKARDALEKRAALTAAFEWRYTRHSRQVRLGQPTTDNLTDLDDYMDKLVRINEQPGFPEVINWPSEP